MNILITSIGQRGYLIDHFRESSNGEFGIFAADATKYAPALHNADRAFIIPMAKDVNYYPELLNLCKKNNIAGIVSINDLELPVLARHKEELANNGILAVISEPEIIDICFDKYKTYKFCKENDIPVPRTYLWSDKDKILGDIDLKVISYPMIAKPRKGSRSIGVHLIYSEKQLLEEINNISEQNIPEDEKIMFQEYIDSEQFSIHIFNDYTLNPVCVVGMVNIFKHLGETFHIKTYRDDSLIELGKSIGNKLKHFGPLSADVHKRDNGEYVVLEFNPRISGCYSLSHYAGADFPGKIYNLIKKEPIKFDRLDSFDDGIIMLKQFSTQMINESMISNKMEN